MYFFCVILYCYGRCAINKKQRIQYGSDNFSKFVIPILKNHGYTGVWEDHQNSWLDMTCGIDYSVNGTTIAARVWRSPPKPHYSIRMYNISAPHIPLEYDRMLYRYNHGLALSDITVEAFIWEGTTTIGITPTRRIFAYLQNARHLDTFKIKTDRSFTVFSRVPWDAVGPVCLLHV